jgi:glycosyltransferase involved in cell wall biosynthesis
LKLTDDDFVMIQVARLDALKDHLTAVRTMHHVVRALPAAQLLIVGEGPEEGKIRTEIQRLGLGANIHLLGLRHDVPRLLAAADVFLLTSVSEGIPLTIIEAMAARLPVVSTNVGGISEVVEDEATGLLAPAGDDLALADRLLRVANSPNHCAQLVVAAQRRATDLFSERKMIDDYRRLYDRMLAP